MPYSNIDKSSKYFNTVLWTGNSSAQSITGVGFKPDIIWNKSRNTAVNHRLMDSVRGTAVSLIPSDVFGDQTGEGVSSFNTDGFSFSANFGGDTNVSGQTYVAWNWLASNTSTSNTQGTITSTVSANTTSGVSIVTYTGNGSSSATVGHGLGVAPSMILNKCRTGANAEQRFFIYHKGLSANNMISFNSNAQAGTGTYSSGILSTSPTSTTFGFTAGSGGVINVNESSSTYVSYCFADVKGFSKFGSYTGNGASGNGTFTYLGFKPAFVMIKEISGVDGWGMFDNKRVPYNYVNTHVQAQSTSADITNTADAVDFLSNGFKVATGTSSANFINESGATYIYMAFAENPFVSSKGIPTCAR